MRISAWRIQAGLRCNVSTEPPLPPAGDGGQNRPMARDPGVRGLWRGHRASAAEMPAWREAAGFRYRTPYRGYSLAKAGFALAYLWYVLDFFRIHAACRGDLPLLLPDPRYVALTGSPALDAVLRPMAVFLNRPPMVATFVVLAPIAAVLFLWGRRKGLQVAVGGWMSFSMIALNCLLGVFSSTVDVWVNLNFVVYALAAAVTPADEWDRAEPGFSPARWRANPTLCSTYAWLVVWVQFLVYIFAGVNKLVLGWVPWTSGVALQNLAIDSSMRDFVRGVPVPFWISLVLCYVTLLQRLAVPWGFFFRRWRFWSVLILGTMHLGYALLMNVNLFPLIGIAALLMILPPREPDSPALAPLGGWGAKAVVGLFALALTLESARLTHFRPAPWENKLMVTPSWRMFADGGAVAGGEWRVIVVSPRQRLDGTEIPLAALPHLWRDRFYINNIFNDLMNRNMGPGSLVDRLGRATRIMYREREIAQGLAPSFVGVGFELYRWSPAAESAPARP